MYYIEDKSQGEEKIKDKEFVVVERWDSTKLRQYISEEMVEHIVKNISTILMDRGRYKAWWMGDTSEIFIVKSSWEMLRHKREKREIF